MLWEIDERSMFIDGPASFDARREEAGFVLPAIKKRRVAYFRKIRPRLISCFFLSPALYSTDYLLVTTQMQYDEYV